MKKLLSLVAVMLLTTALMAQTTIPNSGFETWSNNEPTSWKTTMSGNVIVTMGTMNLPIPVSANFGSQSTDAHSGSYALKLQAQTVGVAGTEYSYTFPGMAQLGTAGQFNIPMSTIQTLLTDPTAISFSDVSTLTTLAQLIAHGDALSQTPASVKMWVKYLPQNGDSLHVIAYTKHNMTPVAYASFGTGETMSDYTEITVPFDNPFTTCDSICIVVFSGGFNTNLTTELYVDDVTLSYAQDSTGIQDHNSQSVAIYPNPATNYVTINPANQQVYQYQMMDLTGKVVRSQAKVSGKVTIDTRSMAPGIYMLRMNQNGATTTRKVVVK